MKPILAALACALFIVPAAAQAWGNDAIQEPSSAKYDTQRYQWQTPNDITQRTANGMRERVYFNAQLSVSFLVRHANVDGHLVGVTAANGRLDVPVLVHADALLGYWRDCNNDGYIGNVLTGMKDYLQSETIPESSATPLGSPGVFDPRVCPPGTEYAKNRFPGVYSNLGPVIHEFLDIGPARGYYQSGVTWQVNDPQARVWGDVGAPDERWTRKQEARDPLAAEPYNLPFATGTFDNPNGLIRYADLALENNLDAITGGAIYNTPFGTYDLSMVKQRYNSDSPGGENGLVRTWSCDDETAEPQLAPDANPDGSVADSVNNTVMGLSVRETITNPLTGGTILRVNQQIGQGCDGEGGAAILNAGAGRYFIRLEDPTISPSDTKDTVDWFFQYRPPHDQTTDQLTAAWGLVPRADRTLSATWYGHQMFVMDLDPVRNADYFTFYANVGPVTLARSGQGALPSGFASIGSYGREACQARTLNWNCDPAAWDRYYNSEWGVKLNQEYDLRDVDCTDFTPASDADMDVLKGAVNALAMDTINEPAFTESCG